MKINYTLYSRPGCHLCDDMLQQLGEIENISINDITVLNIETNPLLLKKFGNRIPVLFINDKEFCNGKLDLVALKDIILSKSTRLV